MDIDQICILILHVAYPFYHRLYLQVGTAHTYTINPKGHDIGDESP
jgi:hypothetical protein